MGKKSGADTVIVKRPMPNNKQKQKCQLLSTTQKGSFRLIEIMVMPIEIKGDATLLTISGPNGYSQDGQTMPDSFEEQGNILEQFLKSADMDYQNIVSIRTYLSDPSYDEANVQLLIKYLGDNQPVDIYAKACYI
jgi:hypothetical protein